VRDLNALYRTLPALHELDCNASGFEWLITDDSDRGVFAWMRKGHDGQAQCLVVANFTPNVYRDYQIRVPFPGDWREVLNTDSVHYGGSNVGNGGVLKTSSGAIPELNVTIPPLAVIFLVPDIE
jgi:1,4-alpha-glucan branching enzyme